MKKLIFIILFGTTLMACNKEKPIPTKSFDLEINGSVTLMSQSQTTQLMGETIIESVDESQNHHMKINLGETINPSYTFNGSVISGFEENVELEIFGANYYIIDTIGLFYLTVVDSSGFLNGNFNGKLNNSSEGTVEVSGGFKNL